MNRPLKDARFQPRVSSRREYESLVHDFRVSYGLTIRELAERSGVSQNAISRLANGMASPVNRKGGLCKSAAKLCEFFGVEPNELFPRYVCAMRRPDQFEITPFPTASERMSQNPEEIAARKELWEKMIDGAFGLDRDSALSSRAREIFGEWLSGASASEIAGRLGRSRADIHARLDLVFQKLARAALDLGMEVTDEMRAKMAHPEKDGMDDRLLGMMSEKKRRWFMEAVRKGKERRERERELLERKAEEEARALAEAERRRLERHEGSRRVRKPKKPDADRDRALLESAALSVSRSCGIVNMTTVNCLLRSLGLAEMADLSALMRFLPKKKGRKKKSSGPKNS